MLRFCLVVIVTQTIVIVISMTSISLMILLKPVLAIVLVSYVGSARRTTVWCLALTLAMITALMCIS